MDTIFALASARGKAGIAVVRLSGPGAHDAVRELAGDVPTPRRASLRTLRTQGEVLDTALVLVFPEDGSFTGEASAELHLHGSTAVVSAVLRCLGEMQGLRLAEPGEFTRRALERGNLDLTQVEGLADLIEAETEAQRRQAHRILSGAIGRRAQDWRKTLIRAAALIEAAIDFAEEDVPEDVVPEVTRLVDGLRMDLRREAESGRQGERIREGFEVAIVGRPNSGKSTLLNALAGREAAITSEIAGTTRDVIEVRMDLGGLAVTLLDTAGMRETVDPLERIGIERARVRADAADLRIFLLDGTGEDLDLGPSPDDIVVQGKADLSRTGVSGKTGQGIAELLRDIEQRLSRKVAGAGLMTRERHRRAIGSALRSLDLSMNQLSDGSFHLELVAESLRSAIHALDVLVGRVDVEVVLGEIFSSFCIGK